MRRSSILIGIGLVSTALSTFAQTTAVREAFRVVVPGNLPPGVQLPTNIVASGTNGAAKPAEQKPEEKKLQEILKLQFDRKPTSILKELAKQDEKKGNTNDVQRYQNDVVVGNWKGVKEFIAKLPEKQRPQVYDHLLRELQKTPQDNQENGGVRYYNGSEQKPGGQPTSFILAEDVLALSDAAPADLTDEQIEQLGKLLGIAFSKNSSLEPFVARLEQGTERFGGTDSAKRERAAKLLLAANRILEAGKFLPSLDKALEKRELKNIDLHARYLTAFGKQTNETTAATSLQKAWDINQIILSTTNAAVREKEQALSRALELMPLLSKAVGTNWLRETFKQRPEQGMAILSSVGNLVTQGFSTRESEPRRKNLDAQRRVVDSLLDVSGNDSKPWQTALNLLTYGWVQEAEYSKTRHVAARRNRYPTYDQFGNMYYEDPYRYQDYNSAPFIPLDQIIQAAPSDRWIAALDETMAPKIRSLVADLYIKNEQELKALPIIELLATQQPKTASTLANALLDGWAKSHDPNQPQDQSNRRVYYGPFGQQMQQQGMSLTRAMQVRNLQELGTTLNRLRKLPIGNLDEKTIVAAFTASHSAAEVFRVEDIEMVFGPVSGIKTELLAELLQTMRQRLAGQWRQPRIQQAAKTNRNDKEIDAEVVRGYELVTQLIEKGVAQSPNDWRMNLVQGAALFDWAEFDYGKKVDLAIYTAKRDRAFKAFEKASSLYSAKIAGAEDKDFSIQPFMQWFNATLGASDLAYLTRQTEPNTNHLTKIREAIVSLPADPERHIAMFGKAINDSIQTLKAELKPRYLRSALAIVGDHESAVEARKLVEYYNDLLQEVTLDVRVDGENTVGHGKPFGVHVAIRHSESAGRESGGFGKYLQNQQSMGYYYNPYGTPPVNYRDDFEKQVRDKFAETFEIVSVTFHEDKIQPRGYGKQGWRETPYAYLLLKAKDGAVDRLPSLQLDLDFFDKKGQVVLPIVSQVQLIDARPDSVAARPIENVEILQILDERDLTKGALSLEIKATGNGLLPELNDIVDSSFAGFKVEKIDDKGMAITKMDTEGDVVAPVTERNWLINLRVDPASGVPSNFNFPKAKLANAKVTYKHYADADIVEVKPEVALTGVGLGGKSFVKWIVGGVALVIAVVLAVVLRRKKQTAEVPSAPTYTIPGHVTPFTVLNLLQRMQADHTLTLTAEQRKELTQTIGTLQTRYFSKMNERDGSSELKNIAEQWVTVTR